MNIRNIAIIAHVDHGKTTLVDALLRQSEAFRQKAGSGNLIMDSNELERERGITIFSKNASVKYNGYKINIVDTPGHADFGGEVERIMSMAQGALLLVDAKEGPMPQTEFVLKHALAAGLKIIVVINKIDREHTRPQWVLNQTFDLFIKLGATDKQAEFPVIYASGLKGLAGLEPHLEKMKDITPIFDHIIEEIPEPPVFDTPTQMLVVNVFYDNFKGHIAIGPLKSGTLKSGQPVMRIKTDGAMIPAEITAAMVFDGLGRVEVPEVLAGDIVAVAGIADVKIGETIADFENPKQLPPIEIEEPTVQMSFSVNTSPFAGTEGKFSTARHLKNRLERELLNDVALRVVGSKSSDSTFVVSGRGELHLSILIEKMRREGHELQVGKPEVIFHEKDGKKLEPFEDLFIECPDEFSGIVMQEMGKRKGELKNMKAEGGVAFMDFLISTRGLIGYRSQFLTDTKGKGILNTLFHGYLPKIGDLRANEHGSLVAYEAGTSNLYGLLAAQERGTLFLGPAAPVYEGMVVGRANRNEDLVVNVCKVKQLSNMRSRGSGVSDHFDTPVILSLEEAVEYLGNDELLEVTPKSLRLRKTILNANDRKKGKLV